MIHGVARRSAFERSICRTSKFRCSFYVVEGGDHSVKILKRAEASRKKRHIKRCSTESNYACGGLSRRGGRQDKKNTGPARKAAQRICPEARLRASTGARRFGYEGRWSRIRRAEACGAPAPLRSTARDMRRPEKLGCHQRPEPHVRRKAGLRAHRGSSIEYLNFDGNIPKGEYGRGQ
jgi:hypothetical protein